jgi:hypothetical protein
MMMVKSFEVRTDNEDAVFRGLEQAMSVSCHAITSLFCRLAIYTRARQKSIVL